MIDPGSESIWISDKAKDAFGGIRARADSRSFLLSKPPPRRRGAGSTRIAKNRVIKQKPAVAKRFAACPIEQLRMPPADAQPYRLAKLEGRVSQVLDHPRRLVVTDRAIDLGFAAQLLAQHHRSGQVAVLRPHNLQNAPA